MVRDSQELIDAYSGPAGISVSERSLIYLSGLPHSSQCDAENLDSYFRKNFSSDIFRLLMPRRSAMVKANLV